MLDQLFIYTSGKPCLVKDRDAGILILYPGGTYRFFNRIVRYYALLFI